MGILKWDLGDVSGSEPYFEAAGSSFGKAWDLRSKEFCAKCVDLVRLYGLGREDRQAKLSYRSADRFGAAVSLARDIGIPDLQLKCLRQLALARLELGELESFLENSRSGLAIAVRINHRLDQGRCLNNIGIYHQQKADYSQAVIYLEQALAILRSLDDSGAEAECLNNLGLVYRELGVFDRAHHFIEEALSRDQARGDRASVSMDLGNIGSILLRKGLDEGNREDLGEALEAFQASLQTQEAGAADPLVAFTALNNMGIILCELKDHPEARRRFAEALKIAELGGNLLERSHALVNIGTSYFEEMKTDAALDYFRSSYLISREQGFENVLPESCVGLGQCYERLGDEESALLYYQEAIQALEEVKARLVEPFLIGFSRNKFLAYERSVAIWAERYEQSPSEASCRNLLGLVERAKARAFLENLYEVRLDLSGADLQRVRDRQRAISRNIAELSSRLAGPAISEAEQQALEREIEREEEESVRLISEAKRSGGSRIQAWDQQVRSLEYVQRSLLEEGEVLLEYFLSDPSSYLIRISPKDVRLYRLPAQKDLERSLRAYLKSLSDRSLNPRIGLQAAKRIGRELLPPEGDESFLRAKVLLIAPDGILHVLPFEALGVSVGDDLRYLVEDRTVCYCPSASALAILKERDRPRTWPKQVLAVGGPDYQGPSSRASRMNLPPLPFSRKEIEVIARSFPVSTVDILGGGDADESRIKAWPLGDYRIIHFACHGFLDDAAPLRSALVLSAGKGTEDDGLLQMREIYALGLSAELVVLAACQTGIGRLERSEGPLALARPFFYSGARAVLASLWPIGDRSTVPFMQEFYRRLSEGRPASAALREAKLRMIRSRWSHPFFWAGFLLQGDPAAAGQVNSPGRAPNVER
jgi:CHAT domain-containing protein/Tfp pilus assembly protein PilF